MNIETSDVLLLEHDKKEFELFFIMKRRKIIHIQDWYMYINFFSKRLFSKVTTLNKEKGTFSRADPNHRGRQPVMI